MKNLIIASKIPLWILNCNGRYELSYKQAVTAEDLYLQLGNKTTATASCENMIVQKNSLKNIF